MARAIADVAARTIKQLAQAKWQSSGLTDKHARKLRLKPLGAAQTVALSAKFYEAGALHIPYHELDGKPTKFYRIRYLEKLPGAAGLVEKPQRYDQMSTLQEAYYPPLLKKSWEEIAEDTTMPIFITEGELKAACAAANGIPMMALGGVYSFMSQKRGIDLLPSMKRIKWKDRLTYVVYDNDLTENAEVSRAQRIMAETLLAHGAKIYFISIPPGKEKGVDDYIVKHGVGAFYPLVEAAVPHLEGAALWGLNEEVAYIRGINAVIERSTNLTLLPDTFMRHTYANRFYMKQVEKGTGKNRHTVLEREQLAKRWMEWEQRAEMSGVCYEPGHPQIIDGQWNMWSGWGVEAKRGDVEPWAWVLDHLFQGDRKARRYFEQWCAYPIQNPGAKLYTAALLWSRTTGVGKSIVAIALSKIYGSNAVTVNGRELQSGFNSWADRRQFVVGEEITANERRTTADYMKDIITNPWFRINKKYSPEYSIANHANFLLLSNHCDAVFVEDHDRRYFVHGISAVAADRAKYEWVHKWLHGSGPSYLRWHLENLSMQGFNPRERAPETLSKREMISAGKTDVGLWVMRLVEDAATAMRYFPNKRAVEGCDLYTAEQLYESFDPNGKVRGPSSVANMGRALASGGFRQVYGGKTVWTAAGVHRLYAVRNQEKWDMANRKQIVEHYNEFFGPQTAGVVK